MISFLQPNITYHVNWLDGRIINTQYVNHKRFEVFNQALLVKLFWWKCGHFSAFLLSVFRASHMFLCSSYKKSDSFLYVTHKQTEKQRLVHTCTKEFI